MGNNNLMVSGTPHIRSNETITSIMRDVGNGKQLMAWRAVPV